METKHSEIQWKFYPLFTSGLFGHSNYWVCETIWNLVFDDPAGNLEKSMPSGPVVFCVFSACFSHRYARSMCDPWLLLWPQSKQNNWFLAWVAFLPLLIILWPNRNLSGSLFRDSHLAITMALQHWCGLPFVADLLTRSIQKDISHVPSQHYTQQVLLTSWTDKTMLLSVTISNIWWRMAMIDLPWPSMCNSIILTRVTRDWCIYASVTDPGGSTALYFGLCLSFQPIWARI